MNPVSRWLAALWAVFGILTLAAADPVADPGSRFSAGVYGNVGYGSSGATAVPGLTFRWGKFPVKAHFGQTDGTLEAAATVDWLLIDSPITPGFSWYVGPGVYGAGGTGGGHTVYGTGARGVFGFRTVFLDAWETYAAWTPAYGLGWIDGTQSSLWNVDFEVGLRFLFPAGKSEIVTAEAPHPALALVPGLNAFSPGSGGASSQMRLQVSPAYLDRVASWKLTVTDSNGTAYPVGNGRGSLPSSLSWDGKISGANAPEAAYQAVLAVTYTDGTTAEARSRTFAVDLSVPEVSVTLLNRRFSPDGDGKNDEAAFQVAAKAKGGLASWVLTITDPKGQEFYRTGAAGAPPPILTWNGTGTSGGTTMPGGDYTYSVAVTDDLGKTQAAQGVLSVDFVHPVLTLSTDRGAFSPLGLPAKLTFTVRPEKIEAVTGWKLTITDQNKLPVKEFSASGPVPASVAWDGKNALGLISEGTLQARLTVFYTKDDVGTADASPFEIDTTAPKVSVTLGNRHFLPDGDGVDEVQTFALAAESRRGLQSWRLKLTGPDGAELKSYAGQSLPEAPLVFDGLTTAGTKVAFGADSAWSFEAVDVLGNRSMTKGLLPVDLPRPAVTLTGPAAFSPVGTPAKMTQTADPVPTGLASWRVAIEADGAVVGTQPVRDWSGKGPLPPDALTWDGKTASGTAAADGLYRARLSLVYDRGEEKESVSSPFLLDTQKPQVTATRPDEAWSPDGDGVGDALNLSVQVENAVPIASWTFLVTDPTGTVFTTVSGEGPVPATIPWNGRSSTGELVASEQKYGWSLSVTDQLGKKQTVQGSVATDILVLPKGADLALDLGGLMFQPNKAALVNDGSAAGVKNRELLDKVKTVLARLSQYKITVVGHAVNLTQTAKEEKELQSLSTARAEAVKDALSKLGLDPARMSAVGKGGTDQLVPDTDTVNRWKNRRVEFVLTK